MNGWYSIPADRGDGVVVVVVVVVGNTR